MSEVNKQVGLLGAIAIGIGGMVGGGIFAVLGEAVSLAHGATAVAFLLAGFVALLTSYSYAKLSVAYQQSGGTVVFIDNAFGHNLLSGSINVMLWLSYLVTISLYATAFASYGETFFTANSPWWLKHALISTAIILPSIINLISASFVSKSETLIVIIKIILLVLIIVSGLFYVEPDKLDPSKWSEPFTIIAAGMIIFVAYEGFELIANAAAEIKDPAINLPRALYASVIIVILLYVLISIVTVGTVDETQLLQAKDYALAVAAEPALGRVGFTIVAIAALLSTFSAINATIYGNARLGYALAVSGELPLTLKKLDHDIPVDGILVTTLFSLLIANSIDLTEIAIIGSAGFLLIFALVNFSAFKLRKEINANNIITLIASLASIAALFTLLFHTHHSNPRAIAVFLGFIGLAIVFEMIYGVMVRKHWFQRQYSMAEN
ncbi:MAG: amino acid transporter [Gammaproteobacteria bacterium]|nr:MAG: amino acid transporter [Gammaproteobacteria bacterium]